MMKIRIKVKRLNIAIIAGSVFCFNPITSYAKQYQTISSIKESVSDFLTSELKSDNFTISTVDKRLRLKLCTNKLKSQFPTYSKQLGRTTVEVSCSDRRAWKILVGVNIKKFVNILTAKHSLPAGKLITQNDVSVRHSDVSRMHNGYFTETSQVLNMVVRRPIRAGQQLSPALVKQKQMVTRGDEILILAKTKHLRIKVKGKALMNGYLGQKIKVRNSKSKRILQATVISNGLVEVNM